MTTCPSCERTGPMEGNYDPSSGAFLVRYCPACGENLERNI